MMIKPIGFLLISLVMGLKLYSQEADKSLAEEQVVKGADQPWIESILYNEEVRKQQKTGKMIQATGFREGDEKHFEVHFLRKQLHGEWQSFFDSNQHCDSGSFIKSIPDGEWKTWYPGGQLKSVRNYSAKKYRYIRADIKRNHPKDQRYYITRLAKTNLNVMKHFKPMYPQNGINTSLALLDKIIYNTNTQASHYIPPFSNCLHHGLFVNYFENSLVKDSGHFVNGLKHDLWTESSDDGKQRAFGFYHHSLKHGQWKYYDLNGELRFTETFNHGRITSSHYFKK